MSTYIKSLIAEGEHQQQDFKFCITDSRKIARSISAFSNTNGGRLLVGVKDNGAIAGVRTDEEYYMIEAAAQIYCKPEVNFVSKKHIVDGKSVLEIIIPKTETDLIMAPNENDQWKVYIRVKDQNLLANIIFIKVWGKRISAKPILIQYTENEKAVLKHLENQNMASISSICKTANITRAQAQSILTDFIVLDIIEIIFTEKQVFYCLKNDSKNSSSINTNK